MNKILVTALLTAMTGTAFYNAAFRWEMLYLIGAILMTLATVGEIYHFYRHGEALYGYEKNEEFFKWLFAAICICTGLSLGMWRGLWPIAAAFYAVIGFFVWFFATIFFELIIRPLYVCVLKPKLVEIRIRKDN